MQKLIGIDELKWKEREMKKKKIFLIYVSGGAEEEAGNPFLQAETITEEKRFFYTYIKRRRNGFRFCRYAPSIYTKYKNLMHPRWV